MPDPKVISPGPYCYSREGDTLVPCPYWSRNPDQPEQLNGYCEYLKRGDWEGPGYGLLWDMVKECGINDEEEPGE